MHPPLDGPELRGTRRGAAGLGTRARRSAAQLVGFALLVLELVLVVPDVDAPDEEPDVPVVELVEDESPLGVADVLDDSLDVVVLVDELRDPLRLPSARASVR